MPSPLPGVVILEHSADCVERLHRARPVIVGYLWELSLGRK
jgi:hypothetical protein